MTSEPLNQYTEICRYAIKSSSAKLSKTFENLLLEIFLLYMTIQRKINFTQMERYGTHCEQTYRTNFNRGRAKCIDWVKFNLALCRRYLNMDGLLAIAIDPSYISKSGKKTTHIGTFWSGCASSMKHGRPKTLDGKINYKTLDLTRMAELHIGGLEGTAYTLIVYSKALKQKVRLVIWVMPNGKHKLFFSTKTSMSGEEVLRTYIAKIIFDKCQSKPNQIYHLDLSSIL